MSLQGNLTDLPLIDLLQIFSVQNKKGALLINYGDKEAEIFFEAASLHAAYVYQNLPQGRFVHSQGEEAIYSVMDWPEGHFCFKMDDITSPHRNIFVSWNYLVLEQCRRQDERERQQHLTEIGSRIPHLVPDPPVQAQINLSLDEWRVLLQVNGSASVTTIANTMRQPLNEVVKNLDDLEKKGLIELNNIANFANKLQNKAQNVQVVDDHASATNQVVYYSRAALAVNGASAALPVVAPIVRPANRAAFFRDEPKLMPSAVSAAPVRGDRPKVQRGLISGIMAKIRGL